MFMKNDKVRKIAKKIYGIYGTSTNLENPNINVMINNPNIKFSRQSFLKYFPESFFFRILVKINPLEKLHAAIQAAKARIITVTSNTANDLICEFNASILSTG